MRILDKIVLNRMISLITNFILALVKIFSPKTIDDIDLPKPKPDRRKILPWRKDKT